MPTLTVRVSDSQGNETVTSHPFTVGGGSEQIITGDFSGSVPAGTVGRLRGSVRLLADLHIRGTLVADLTGVDLDGQGLYDIHTHDGGVLNLVGTEKTAWLYWGDSPTGWAVGDRLVVSPTVSAVYTPPETTWQGTWAATTRPAGSPDVTLDDGSIARPEVVNLSQTLLIRNMTRIMLHESGGVTNVHTLKWLRVLNTGKVGVLTMYPIHFHFLGDTCRGSVVEGVVVEGGKNHAFVPHGSHGIDFIDCVAVNGIDDAFWWDPPTSFSHTANNSDDIHWDHCLVVGLTSSTSPLGIRLTGFHLGAGSGNRTAGCVAAAINGGVACSGYNWDSKANNNNGGTVWDFHHNTAHNVKVFGYSSWQNDGQHHPDHIHDIDDVVAYNCVSAGIDHGAYTNKYHWRRMVLGPNVGRSIRSHAASLDADGDVSFEDIVSDAPFEIRKHRADSPFWTIVSDPIVSVIVNESNDSDGKAGHYRFEDTGLVPADFTILTVDPSSVFIILEAGVETHRWQSGVWS